MRPFACFVLAVVLPALAACPPKGPIDRADAGTTDDAGIVDPDVVEAAEYCESIVDFFCPYYLRCGRMAAASVEECRGAFLPACNARFEPSFVSLASEGLLQLSQAGIDACAAHLAAVPCEQQLLDLDGPCATMWRGTQPAGAACGFDVESFVCAPSTACVLDLTFCGTCQTIVDDGARCDIGAVTCAPESTCVDGSCVPRRRVGDSCSGGERCVLGAVCNSSNSIAVCEGPTYVGVGDACDFQNRCPFHSECLAGHCALAVAEGEACDANIPCDTGGFCSGGVCGALTAQGGPCEQGAQCQTGVCAEGACSILPGACFP